MQKSFLIALITVVVLCGCHPETESLRTANSMTTPLAISTKLFLTITNGSSLNHVRNLCGTVARHEFTVLRNDSQFTLVSCYVCTDKKIEDSCSFYFLFRNDVLEKVQDLDSEPPERIPYQGTTMTRTKPWNIEDTTEITKAINAPPLSQTQIAHLLHPDKVTNSHPLNVLPAFLATGFFDKILPKIRQAYKTNEILLQRYDGCRVSIGMNVGNVEVQFGTPTHIFLTKSGFTVRVYGSEEELDVNPMFQYSPVAVLFDDRGLAKAVYSDAFFCDQWMK
jgi:hypothetical protein